MLIDAKLAGVGDQEIMLNTIELKAAASPLNNDNKSNATLISS